MLNTSIIPTVQFILIVALFTIPAARIHAQAITATRSDTLIATAAYETQAQSFLDAVPGKRVQWVMDKFNLQAYQSEGGQREQLVAKLQNYARYLEQEYKATPSLTLLEKEVITNGKEKVLILRFRLSDGQRSSLLSLDYSLTDQTILNLTLPFEVENYRY